MNKVRNIALTGQEIKEVFDLYDSVIIMNDVFSYFVLNFL
jgi:hypothetical protein